MHSTNCVCFREAALRFFVWLLYYTILLCHRRGIAHDENGDYFENNFGWTNTDSHFSLKFSGHLDLCQSLRQNTSATLTRTTSSSCLSIKTYGYPEGRVLIRPKCGLNHENRQFLFVSRKPNFSHLVRLACGQPYPTPQRWVIFKSVFF